jgi:hypothetical protein
LNVRDKLLVNIWTRIIDASIFWLAFYLIGCGFSKTIVHVSNAISSVGIVLVSNFRQILHFSTSHLKDGEENGIIYCVIIPLSLVRLKWFFFNLKKEIYPCCFEMTVAMLCLSIAVICNNLWRIGLWYSYFKCQVFLWFNVARVYGKCFIAMIGCI